MIKITANKDKASVEINMKGSKVENAREFVSSLEALITPWGQIIEEQNFDIAVAKLLAVRKMVLKGKVTIDVNAMKEQGENGDKI